MLSPGHDLTSKPCAPGDAPGVCSPAVPTVTCAPSWAFPRWPPLLGSPSRVYFPQRLRVTLYPGPPLSNGPFPRGRSRGAHESHRSPGQPLATPLPHPVPFPRGWGPRPRLVPLPWGRGFQHPPPPVPLPWGQGSQTPQSLSPGVGALWPPWLLQDFMFDWYYFLLKCLIRFSVKLYWSGISFVGRFYEIKYIYHRYGAIYVFCFFLCQFW